MKLRELPKEGLWISPFGKQFDVTEHLEAIRNHPEIFNLSENETNTNDIQQLRDIGEKLIQDGWIRYRQFEMTFFFECNNIQRNRGKIEDVLSQASTFPSGERVEIAQMSPHAIFQGTVQDFYDNNLTKAAKTLAIHKWAFCVKN